MTLALENIFDLFKNNNLVITYYTSAVQVYN